MYVTAGNFVSLTFDKELGLKVISVPIHVYTYYMDQTGFIFVVKATALKQQVP